MKIKDEFKLLIEEGKRLVENRPRRVNIDFIYCGSERDLKDRYECRKWMMKCLQLLKKIFTKNSSEYQTFRSLYKSYDMQGIIKHINVDFLKDDMLMQISHLETIEIPSIYKIYVRNIISIYKNIINIFIRLISNIKITIFGDNK